MPNTHQTLQDIADILSFESDQTLLKTRLESATMDWDHLVRVGSSHLVLPAIYCRLKAKQLLNTLPKELESYLKEITDLNRERNQQLLAEAQQISQWFKEAGIDHVFLKGTAMLASGYYEDIAERMVGDIDILVSKKYLKKSFNLLKDKTYYVALTSSDPYLKKHRHLERLISDENIGAIEIHKHLLRKKNYKIKPLDILKTKVHVGKINIPSIDFLLKHNALNFSINDYGNYLFCIPLRNWFDTILLLNNSASKKKLSKKYIIQLKYYFNKTPQNFIHKIILFLNNNSKLYSILSNIIHFFRIIKTLPLRTFYFLSKTSYRKEVINKINTPQN